MHRLLVTLGAIALAATPAWPQSGGAPPTLACESVASIGTATMSADGTITMQVRSLPPGPIAEGHFTYPPTHPDHEKTKQHLGGISPGETKSVPPWC